MPSARKLKNKVCVYCGSRPATTWDHVLARSFFPKDGEFRGNLPQVPSCNDCNSRKSEWENILNVIYQFSGTSPSSEMITSSGIIEKNLEHNEKLANYLRENFFDCEFRTPAGIYYRQSVFNLSDDITKAISQWNKYIAKAMYYNWKGSIISGNKTLLALNPYVYGMHEYFLGSIEATSEHHSISRPDGGWRVLMAESVDGVILVCIEFNSIVQYVAILEDRYSKLAQMLSGFAY